MVVFFVIVTILHNYDLFFKNIFSHTSIPEQKEVQVVSPKKEDDEDVDISKTEPGQVPVRDHLLAKLDPKDASSVFLVVDAIQANTELSNNCHNIAHDIGHKAYSFYGFSGAMNFTDAERLNHASVQDICAGGYVHGVLEEAALHTPGFENNPGVMCADVPDAIYASCLHGVGHALMFVYHRNVTDSLNACRNGGFPKNVSRCFEGVWMELFWGKVDLTNGVDVGFDTKRPLEPCVDTANDAKPACFLYSPFGYLRTHSKDYMGAIQLCTTSSLSENDAEFCLKGVGITMISHFRGRHLEGAEAFVAGLSDSKKYVFYKGMLNYAMFSGVNHDEVKNSCTLFTTDKEICKEVISEIK
jgi:hypothetical protein